MGQLPARSSGLLDAAGRSIPAQVVARVRQGGRMGASLAGGGWQGRAFPYDASAWSSTEMGDWLPWLRSADSEINIYRDRMVARQRDLVRNDGWAAGLIGRILDSTIGGYYRMVAKPDYRALAARFGSRYDAVWADDYRRAAEARWRTYSEDPGHYNDVSRQLSVSQQLRLALGHKLVDGEDLLLRYWLPGRIGRGAARYATAYMVLDPDRLSNPYQQPDQKDLRGGVEIDELGVPIAYHVRRAHQNDWYNSVESMEWDRVVREDEDGWLRVIHDFDRGRAGQNRGVSIFAPVLSRMKMLARYYGVRLQQEVVTSVFGTYVTSPYDRQMIEQALEGSEEGENEISMYADMRASFPRDGLQLDDVRMGILAPGEEINQVASPRAPGDMKPFAHEMLRSVGACVGVSGEQITGDYSEVNFSSMRVGIVNSEKMYQRRLFDFNSNTASPIYCGWLHEAHNAGDMTDVMPRNAPNFVEARAELSRCRWLGAARGWYDPVAERQGKVLGLDAAFDTLENVAAEQGLDWEENIDQRGIEARKLLENDLPWPKWFGEDASQASQKPEEA